MERVTDDQFALIDGHVRHVPGGVDEYLSLLDGSIQKSNSTSGAATPNVDAQGEKDAGQAPTCLSNAERRELKKRYDAVARKLQKLEGEPERLRARMAELDASDYQGLMDAQAQIDDVEAQVDELETEWIELSDRLGLD